MENYNRSHRYRNDDRSTSNERNNDNRWDTNYNRSGDDWREDDYRNREDYNRNVYSTDRDREWRTRNDQLNDLNWNIRSGGNYNEDYNRDYYNRYNRNYGNDYPGRKDLSRGSYNERYSDNDRFGPGWRYDDYSNTYKNEGWRDNYRNEDRDWWDRTKDEVASWFGDEDARRRRNRDENTNHRGKGPKNYRRSQERIKEDVSDKLSDDYLLDATDIEVEVNGSEVTLNGTVDSRYAKRRAEDIAEDITGVTHVQNNLRARKMTEQENRNNPKYNPITSATANRPDKSKATHA